MHYVYLFYLFYRYIYIIYILIVMLMKKINSNHEMTIWQINLVKNITRNIADKCKRYMHLYRNVDDRLTGQLTYISQHDLFNEYNIVKHKILWKQSHQMYQIQDIMQTTWNDRTQDPQYSKTAVLKNCSTQKPQYSKSAVLKSRSYYNIIAAKKKFTKNVDNCLKCPNHPSKDLYYFCISHCTLRKSMTMVYKFHSVQIVKLFSKPQNLHK